ncbi:unnamed protein product [Caenorhabditis angaria]|uniref:PAN-3 domain-containing protein n=1 Tax=Caenorhabditis angaria TaxID=860376 RepID=A0A9P1MX93_9PELO|nr:unnamed protein product [Caenorhabditis angaria]
MFFSTFIIFAILPYESSGVMLTFYATYDSSSCTALSTLSWDDCVTNCNDNVTCFYALSTSDIPCSSCGYDKISGIVYSSSETDTIISLKSDVTDCKTAQELLEAQEIYKLKVCTYGFYKLIREDYIICQAVLIYHITFNRTVATTYCDGKNGVVLGLWSGDERVYFSNKTNQFYNSSYSIWINYQTTNGINWTSTDPYLPAGGDDNNIVWASGHPISGNNCASLQAGTYLVQSEPCIGTTCSTTYCPRSIICGNLIG